MLAKPLPRSDRRWSTGNHLGASGRPADLYRDAIETLLEAGVPFLVGGGFAFWHYTGIERRTKELDLFVKPQDAEWALGALESAGHRVELIAPHWLGKVVSSSSDEGRGAVDVIFGAGNGVTVVDDAWFFGAETASVLGLTVSLCPPEEMIWSKAYVLERERYDGADVAHLIRALGRRLDWPRLVARFERHWQVLFSHLMLFRFIYPAERRLVPQEVMQALTARLQDELAREPALPTAGARVCQGTLLSARQYLVDIETWKYDDARLAPEVQMTGADIDLLTKAVKAEEARAQGELNSGRGG